MFPQQFKNVSCNFMMWFCDTILTYCPTTTQQVHTFPLWVNYLLSEHRSMWIGIQPTWTHSETHLAGLETEVDACLFVCLLRLLGGWMHSFSSPLHTQSSVRDLFTQPGARAYRHSLLTYITATCPGRHWSLSHNTRKKTEGKQYTTITNTSIAKLGVCEHVWKLNPMHLWIVLTKRFTKMNPTSQLYHSLRHLKDPIKCGKCPVHPLLMFNGASKTGTAPTNHRNSPKPAWFKKTTKKTTLPKCTQLMSKNQM